jgi:hypothetical protein
MGAATKLHNTLSKDREGHDSQITAFVGAKHYSPTTNAGSTLLVNSGATNFTRTWLVIRNPATNAASIWLGYEDDVVATATNRQGWEIPPGGDWAGPVSPQIEVHVFCSAAQLLNCQEVG